MNLQKKMMQMNKKIQQKFNKTELELVMLNNLTKRNDSCQYHIRKALEHLGYAYDVTGGR